MYYYNNQGILRGEVPILGYRSHRLIFDEDTMYYSISETKLAQVNRLGQVTNVFDLDHYKLHHDYVFDKDGNLLILATDTTQDSILLLMKKIDENKNTFQLVDSFKVPYSGYVSSVQNIDNNTVVDSGFQGIFAEYDSNHNKIASYKMNIENYIYRVYKYDFTGFYFSK